MAWYGLGSSRALAILIFFPRAGLQLLIYIIVAVVGMWWPGYVSGGS